MQTKYKIMIICAAVLLFIGIVLLIVFNSETDIPVENTESDYNYDVSYKGNKVLIRTDAVSENGFAWKISYDNDLSREIINVSEIRNDKNGSVFEVTPLKYGAASVTLLLTRDDEFENVIYEIRFTFDIDFSGKLTFRDSSYKKHSGTKVYGETDGKRYAFYSSDDRIKFFREISNAYNVALDVDNENVILIKNIAFDEEKKILSFDILPDNEGETVLYVCDTSDDTAIKLNISVDRNSLISLTSHSSVEYVCESKRAENERNRKIEELGKSLELPEDAEFESSSVVALDDDEGVSHDASFVSYKRNGKTWLFFKAFDAPLSIYEVRYAINCSDGEKNESESFEGYYFKNETISMYLWKDGESSCFLMCDGTNKKSIIAESEIASSIIK